ncbi:hypothetical protein ACFZC6_29615 [Streptomyces ossamyceticus]|uniref:hypothetical protein n=1 Tax=Streptomyces ossamyceticus TaxID=249581 RepID=UPI0036EFC09B
MRGFFAGLREVLAALLPPVFVSRLAAVDPQAVDTHEPPEPLPLPSAKPVDDLWPFEPYDNFVRPYVLSPEELYVHGLEVGGVPA